MLNLLSNKWFYWCMLLPMAPITAQTGMTLEQCLKYGYDNQVSVQNANLDREMATAKIGETRADGLPQIDGYADYSQLLEPAGCLFARSSV